MTSEDPRGLKGNQSQAIKKKKIQFAGYLGRRIFFSYRQTTIYKPIHITWLPKLEVFFHFSHLVTCDHLVVSIIMLLNQWGFLSLVSSCSFQLQTWFTLATCMQHGQTDVIFPLALTEAVFLFNCFFLHNVNYNLTSKSPFCSYLFEKKIHGYKTCSYSYRIQEFATHSYRTGSYKYKIRVFVPSVPPYGNIYFHFRSSSEGAIKLA